MILYGYLGVLMKKISDIDALETESDAWNAAVNDAIDTWLKLDKHQQAQVFLALYETLSETHKNSILVAIEEKIILNGKAIFKL